jgi:putative membrane protein
MRMTTIAFACLLAGPALAQEGGGQLPQSEQIFLDDAARIDQSQIRLGELALQKSTTPRVRQLAQSLVDDARKGRDRLRLIAGSERLRLPPEPTDEQRSAYQQLAKLEGSEFDRAYLDQLNSVQLETNALYDEEVRNGRNMQLRAFAREAVPILQRHQQMLAGLPAPQ